MSVGFLGEAFGLDGRPCLHSPTMQELLYEDSVSIVQIWSTLEETFAMSARHKLRKSFGPFWLKSDQALESAMKRAVNATIALGRQAGGLSVALEVTAFVKQAQYVGLQGPGGSPPLQCHPLREEVASCGRTRWVRPRCRP